MFMWAPLYRSSRLKNKKRKLIETPAVGPPPQQPSCLWDVDGLLLCVHLSDGGTSSFLRFKIPNDTINHLIRLADTDYSGGINRYVRHSHDIGCDNTRFSDYSLNPQLNGPFPSQLTFFGSTTAIGSVVYGIDSSSCTVPYFSDRGYNPHCHAVHYCDFAQWFPCWNLTSLLPYHQYSPVMVTVNKQLYMFENQGIFKDDEDDDYATFRGPLGFLFDPNDESCKELPYCAFHSVGVDRLMVASLGQKLLVLDKKTEAQYYYDIENSTWIPLDIKGLLDHISDFRMQPISVPGHNTVYWIDKKRRIRAFDWVNLKMFVGAVVGFGSECNLRNKYMYFPTLVHLKDDLFCLVWSDDNRLHLTVLRVCLYNTCETSCNIPHHLAAFVVACSCYHLEQDSASYSITAAYLL